MVFKRKAKSRKSYFRTSKRRSSKSSSGMTPAKVIMAGAVYGALRPIAANMLPDFFNVGPVSSDNAIIGAAGYYGMTKGSGFTKALGTIALASETGMVAAKAVNGQMNVQLGSQQIDLTKVNY